MRVTPEVAPDFQQSQARERKARDDLALVARYISEIGPHINQVARLSHQNRESVRYRYRKLLRDRGVSVQGVPHYAHLGFTRFIAFAKLAPEVEGEAANIFTTMSELCYLHSFTRTLLTKEYIIHFAVPRQLKEEVSSLLRRLRQVGLFTELRVFEFGEMRNPPMKAEFYDFGDETWDSFEWPNSNPGSLLPFCVKQEEVAKYDRFDLLILKELERDANQNLVMMARRVQVNFRLLQFHYQNHVLRRGLVKSYVVVWQGSGYDFERSKVIAKKDSYVEIVLFLEGASNSENAELRTILNKLPFLWSEALEPNYCVELYVPLNLYVQFLEYISPFSERVGAKLKLCVMDQTRALRYTISYRLFDPETKSWRLDSPRLIGEFESLLAAHGAGGSTSSREHPPAAPRADGSPI